MTAETQTVRDLAGQTITVRVTLDDPAAAGHSLATDHDTETQAQFLAGYLAGVYGRTRGVDAIALGREVHDAGDGDVIHAVLTDLASGCGLAWLRE